MTQYQFSLATEKDDQALQLRMAQDVMDGPICVSFRRSPSYFAGSLLQGSQSQIITCTDSSSDCIVGLGTRTTLNTYINGQSVRTGYLCDLRGDHSVRGGTLLARGYRYLNTLHTNDPIPLYYSMIIDGNDAVLSLLSSGRAKLPRYISQGKFNTPAIMLGGKRKFQADPQLRIKPAAKSELHAVLEFVNRCYQQFQFAPVYEVDDFYNGRLSGLNIDDLLVARKNDRIVGVTGCWDQSAIRQIHIERYSASLGMVRPVYNLSSLIMPHKPLPQVGQSLACFYLCMIAIEDNDPNIFSNLLESIYAARRTGPWQLFFAGLHERHPLNAVLDRFRQIKAAGQLFAVHWPDNKDAYQSLDERIPHIEAGAL